MRVLVVEDDAQLRALVADGLRRAGSAVDVAGSRAEADQQVAVNAYDCLVLDRGLPDGDGLQFVTALRQKQNAVPILLLTAMDAVHHRVSGFESGADDYLVKPFAMTELVARVRALARRTAAVRSPIVQVGTLSVDLSRRRVARDGIVLSVTAKEFAVLEVLSERPGEVISRSELIERCWDELNEPMSNVVDVVIGQLRRRLGEPSMIRTVRGAGYSLDEAAT